MENLRDQIAIQVLAALLSNNTLQRAVIKDKIPAKETQDWHARTAYQFADTMLEIRTLTKEQLA